MDKKMRVAVYCRVSTRLDSQDGSFDTQIRHFTRYVTAHENMVLVGVYGDYGKSGRFIEGRTEFQRMLADCEAGRIDLILTKSISRFARNMLDCVSTIRTLRELGVAVRFEREGFETDGMYSELMLSVLAAIAQEESVSLSHNRKLADAQRNRMGCPCFRTSYGYARIPQTRGQWEIVESEARRVRLAFLLACEGRDYTAIRKALQRLEDQEATGKTWSRGPIVYMLTNVSYIGAVLTNKCYRVEVNGRNCCRRNCGDVDQYFIENHHAPLVSREVFQVVQQLVVGRLLVTGRRKELSDSEVFLLARAGVLAGREFGREAV